MSTLPWNKANLWQSWESLVTGKSTLLNILAQLDCPTSGKVILKGRDLSTIKGKGKMSAFSRQILDLYFRIFIC